jgi:phenylalanyl-tRNA synthetase beta chain
MNISFQWLKTLVDLEGITPQQVADKLTFAGIEVEAVRALVTNHLITSGYVLERKLIEGSDHLSHVIVDTGHHGIRSIVCGAPNIRAGQKVLIALPGAKLDKVTIQKSIIRGVESNGMVCSLLELGLDSKFLRKEQIDGIEVLDEQVAVGDDHILEKLGYADTILELKLLANRPDLLSVYHVAIEVGALFERVVKDWRVEEKNTLLPSNFSINVSSKRTPQFSIRVIKGITQIPTPMIIQSRLIASGIRPISFLVDIGNYVMLLTGQPLHMYDLKKLPSPSLLITDTYKNSFIALDEKEYSVDAHDISILSEDKMMCLAGVMGAQACAVDEQTVDIAIEAAQFDATTIRKTALRLNLISDASIRFSKGVDLSSYEDVLVFTTQLLQSLTTMRAVYQTVSVSTLEKKEMLIPFSADRINALLGTKFSESLMIDTLRRLKINVQDNYAIIPQHRVDMETQADLAEEIIRLLGFDTIEVSPLTSTIAAGGLTTSQEKKRRVKAYLKSRGISEILTYTLVDEKGLQAFNYLKPLEPISIKNPLSDDRKWIRSSLPYSVLQTVQYNVDRQMNDGQYFEISNIQNTEEQRLELVIVFTGEKSSRGLLEKKPVNFFDLKGVIEGLFSSLNIDASRYQYRVDEVSMNELHPGRSTGIYFGNQRVGVFGELSPLGKETFGFGKLPVVFAQLKLDAFIELKTSAKKMDIISKYPTVYRDIALIIDRSVTYQTLVQNIKKTGKQKVKAIDIFDIYQSDTIGQDKVSLALRISLSDEQKTLQEQEIQEVMEQIKLSLVTSFKVEFRS